MSEKNNLTAKDIMRNDLLDGVRKITKTQKNFTTYKPFFNPSDIEFKLYPLTIADNKRIAELMESVPEITTINNITGKSYKDVEIEVDSIFNQIQEAQNNVNDIISEKITTQDGNSVNVGSLNLIDYQFCILNIFTIVNNGINYKVNLSRSREQIVKDMTEDEQKKSENPNYVPDRPKDKVMNINIPLDEKILLSFRKKLEHKESIDIDTKENKKYKVEFDYKVRRMLYKTDGNILSVEDLNKEFDFSSWRDGLRYELPNGTIIVFKLPSIKEFYKLYFSAIKLQKMSQIEGGKSYNVAVIDSLIDIYSGLMIGVTKEGVKSMIDIRNDDEFKNELKNVLYNLSPKQFYEISNVVFKHMIRMEIDVNVYTTGKSKKLLTSDTWFDSGLSFFFNL